jgi:hypothetical protein
MAAIKPTLLFACLSGGQLLALIAEALQANERVDLRGFGERPEAAPKPQPSHRGDHHHRRKAGCELQIPGQCTCTR